MFQERCHRKVRQKTRPKRGHSLALKMALQKAPQVRKLLAPGQTMLQRTATWPLLTGVGETEPSGQMYEGPPHVFSWADVLPAGQ